MQFMFLGYDNTDEGAMARRLAVRENHPRLGAELVAKGQMLYGAAILDDNGKMIGSMLVLDFPSREELDAWLSVELYVTADVWAHDRGQVDPHRHVFHGVTRLPLPSL